MPKPHTATFAFDEIVSSIATPVWIGEPFNIETDSMPDSALFGTYSAVWDTGATQTVITSKVVDDFGFVPLDVKEVMTVNGKAKLPLYLLSILLPNRLGFDQIEVVAAQTLGEEDVLIGMDIITEGDFAITNVERKTVFSFRVPSQERIDFQEPAGSTAV